MKKYRGNKKPFVYAVYAGADREEASKVLEKLYASGCEVCWEEKDARRAISKACCVILFISESSADSEAIIAAVEEAEKQRKPIISVFLGETVLSPGLSMVLGEIQGIMKYRETEESFY